MNYQSIKNYWYTEWRKKIDLFFFVTLALLSLPILCENLIGESSQNSDSEMPRWESIDKDLEITEFSTSTTWFFNSTVHAARSTLTRYQIGIIFASDFGSKKMEVSELAHKSKASVLINGSFFDKNGDPLGLIISKGIIRHPLQTAGNLLTGIVIIRNGKLFIEPRSQFSTNKVTEALQAGPRLLAQNVKVEALNQTQKAERSALCIDTLGRVVLIATTGGSGLTFEDFQDLLLNKPFSCSDALNFDGGSSSQFYATDSLTARAPPVRTWLGEGRDSVPIGYGFFLR